MTARTTYFCNDYVIWIQNFISSAINTSDKYIRLTWSVFPVITALAFVGAVAFETAAELPKQNAKPEMEQKKPAQDGDLYIIAFGDSLTAGYGLPTGQGFVPKLEEWINNKLERPVTIINAGVSGDTSSGGLSRLDWSLGGVKGKPDLVIVELGANDGLRGISPKITRQNLDKIIKRLADKNINILFTGMLAPPNLGAPYTQEFNSLYTDLAAKYIAEGYALTFYPFFLDGVAAIPNLNQPDGIHPTSAGVDIIVQNIGPSVIKALK